MATSFDPKMLINASLAGKMSTRMVPAPAGDYVGMITDKLDVQTQVIKNGPRAGESFLKLNVPVQVDGDPKLESIGRAKHTFRIEVLLDMTPNGTLDSAEGKNVGLGRLREAVGMNTDAPFNLGMLVGQPIKFTCEHQVDDKDPEVIYERTKAVRSISSEK